MITAGVAHPDIGPGGLTSDASFGSFYTTETANKYTITDFDNGATRVVDTTTLAVPSIFSQANFAEHDLKGWFATGGKGATMISDFETDDDFVNLLTKVGTNEQGLLAVALLRYVYAQNKAQTVPTPTTDITAFLKNKTNERLARAAVKASEVATSSPGTTTYTKILVRPRIVATMSSGILAAPGESTGSLLVRDCTHSVISVFFFLPCGLCLVLTVSHTFLVAGWLPVYERQHK